MGLFYCLNFHTYLAVQKVPLRLRRVGQRFQGLLSLDCVALSIVGVGAAMDLSQWRLAPSPLILSARQTLM